MNLNYQQEYLAAMGINYYLPRAPLPYAAESPDFLLDDSIVNCEEDKSVQDPEEPAPIRVDETEAASLLQEMLGKVEKIVHHNPIPKTVLSNQPRSIQPFSLSVWRPVKGFLIIADRTGQALPTELLIHNIFRYYFDQTQLKVEEEILKWPAAGQVKLAMTELDAREELQTWLSVQCEFQMLDQIWFFGQTWKYFVREEQAPDHDLSCCLLLGQTEVSGKCFPSLAEILMSPQLKADVLARL